MKKLISIIFIVSLIFITNADVVKTFDKIDSELCYGTTRILFNNHDAWYARWNLISNAKESIKVAYFIVSDDIFGRSFMGLLLRKAKEGVKVKFLLDAKGSMDFATYKDDFLEELAGYDNFEMVVYNQYKKSLPDIFKNIRFVSAANHDKILIVDDELCITGGRNIASEYFNIPEDGYSWIDKDVVIKSQTVADELEKAFDNEWKNPRNEVIEGESWNISKKDKILEYAADAMERFISGKGFVEESKLMREYKVELQNISRSGEDPEERGLFKPVTPDMYNEELSNYPSMVNYSNFRLFKVRGGSEIKILDKLSYVGRYNNITSNLVDMIDNTEKELIIQNPYVILTEEAMGAIKRAAKRGVKVTINTNSPLSTDSILTQVFFLKDYKDILSTGNIRILVHNDIMIHAKIFIFDRKVCTIGTYNLDPISEQVNSEVVTMINNDLTASELAYYIYWDMKESMEITTDTDLREIGSEDAIKKIKFLQKYEFLRPLF